MKLSIKKYRTLIQCILGLIIMLIGLGGIIYSCVMQMILCYEKFGVIIGGQNTSIIIPHISLLGLLGIIPMGIGYLIISKS